jgi:hypothetical protein
MDSKFESEVSNFVVNFLTRVLLNSVYRFFLNSSRESQAHYLDGPTVELISQEAETLKSQMLAGPIDFPDEWKKKWFEQKTIRLSPPIIKRILDRLHFDQHIIEQIHKTAANAIYQVYLSRLAYETLEKRINLRRNFREGSLDHRNYRDMGRILYSFGILIAAFGDFSYLAGAMLYHGIYRLPDLRLLLNYYHMKLLNMILQRKLSTLVRPRVHEITALLSSLEARSELLLSIDSTGDISVDGPDDNLVALFKLATNDPSFEKFGEFNNAFSERLLGLAASLVSIAGNPEGLMRSVRDRYLKEPDFRNRPLSEFLSHADFAEIDRSYATLIQRMMWLETWNDRLKELSLSMESYDYREDSQSNQNLGWNFVWDIQNRETLATLRIQIRNHYPAYLEKIRNQLRFYLFKVQIMRQRNRSIDQIVRDLSALDLRKEEILAGLSELNH